MARDRAGRHPARPVMRTRALLARSRGETGTARLWTLATISQGLRERLDACDDQLRGLLADAAGTDRVVSLGGPLPAPHDPLDAYADLDEALRQLEGAHGGY